MANTIRTNQIDAVVNSLVKSNKVAFVQLYVSVDGEDQDGPYTNWMDYVHLKGGHGTYQTDGKISLMDYVLNRFGAERGEILSVQFLNTAGDMITMTVED